MAWYLGDVVHYQGREVEVALRYGCRGDASMTVIKGEPMNLEPKTTAGKCFRKKILKLVDRKTLRQQRRALFEIRHESVTQTGLE